MTWKSMESHGIVRKYMEYNGITEGGGTVWNNME